MTSRSVMPSCNPVLIIVLLIGHNHDAIATTDVTSYVSASTELTLPVDITSISNDVKTASTLPTLIGVTEDNVNVVSTSGCGTTKGCLHYPIGCQSPGNCVSVLTWTTTESGFVDFEMMAPSSGWVAVAFSPTTTMVSG